MDDIVLRCAARCVLNSDNMRYCRNDIVKRTYGFDYHNNFRFMLIRLLGIVNVEFIEDRVDAAKYDAMRGALSALKVLRDKEAHTHVKGTGRTINAPSVTIAQFPLLYDGLVDFDRVLRKYRW